MKCYIDFSTGIKRVLEGEIRPAASKAEEGKLHVKYTTVPLTPETKYSVLETDYDNYAVLWSCSGLGPVHTQNAWIMTRKRLPPGEVLQKVNLFSQQTNKTKLKKKNKTKFKHNKMKNHKKTIFFFFRLMEFWTNTRSQKPSS